jgi:transposase
VLTLPPSVRIHLAVEPVNLRMSFRGLSGLVRQRLQEDPLSGHLFCWLNRRRTMMKILFHDRTGYCIFYKRLSRGSFQLPSVPEGATQVRLDAGELALILEGIDLTSARRRLRHRRQYAG